MQFFVMELQVGVPSETWFSKMEPVHRGEPLRCPMCGGVVSGLQSLPPYRVELLVHGKASGDVAFNGTELLLSARFRAAWESAHLRGLDFAAVDRLRVRPARLGRKSFEYFYVVPKFFGTHVDIEHSMIEHEDQISCNQCHYGGLIKSIRGMRINEATWSGEDIFLAWGLCGTIIVSDRVRRLRDDHGLTNINLTPVEEYFWDPYNQWTPVDYSRDDVAAPEESPEPSHSN
jgi:hypothetical protein